LEKKMVEAQKELGLTMKALELTLGREMTKGEKMRLFAATTPGIAKMWGPGGGQMYEEATPEELAKIFGNEIREKFSELNETIKRQKLIADVNINLANLGFAGLGGGTPGTTKTEALD